MRQGKTEYDTMKKIIEKKLYERKVTLNPFKLDPVNHIHRYALTPHEWTAIKFIRRNRKIDTAIMKTNRVEIEFPIGSLFHSFSVSVNVHDRLLDIKTPWNSLPGKVQDYLMQWGKYERELRGQSADVSNHFEKCGDTVNTWGQLYRMWPSILSLMPMHQRRRVQAQKAKSSVPEYMRVDSSGATREIFSPERIHKSDMVIAEALLLPPPPENALVPSVSFNKASLV